MGHSCIPGGPATSVRADRLAGSVHWNRLVCRSHWHCEQEAAAFVRHAFDPDAPAVLLNDAAAERKAKSVATAGTGVGGVSLMEAVEYLVELLGGNASALILD